MAYGQKYKLQYRTVSNELIVMIMSMKDYSGSLIPIISDGSAIIMKLDKTSDDRFEPIKPTSCSIQFFVDTAGDYDEFYEIDNFKYKVEIWKDSVLYWSGWLNDEIFTEAYSSGKYFVSLTATDGLSILKGRYTALTGRQSHMTIIRESLTAIGLGLNIVDCINIIEVEQTTGGPLNQTYFDTNIFTDDKKRWTLDKVLSDVLRTYGAFLTQVDSKWVISNVESLFNGLTGSEYTSEGVYVDSYVNADEKVISNQQGTGLVTLLTGGTIQKNKGWKELTVRNQFGKVNTSGILLNGDFETHPGYSSGDDYSGNFSDHLLLTGWNPSDSLMPLPHMGVKIRNNATTGDYAFIIEPGLTENAYYIQSSVESATRLEQTTNKIYVFSFLYAMLADSVVIGSKQSGKLKVEVVDDDGNVTHYLTANPTVWTTVETYIVTEEVNVFGKDAFDWTQGKLIIIGFPGGRLRITLYSEHKLFSIQYNGVAWDKIEFYSLESQQTANSSILTGTPTNNPEFVEIPSEVEFVQTDVPVNNIEDAALYFKNYLSLSDGNPTNEWSSETHSGTLAKIYLLACLEAHGRSVQIKKIPGKGVINPLTRLIDHKGTKFQITGYTYTLKTKIFDCQAVEIIEPGTIPITANFSQDESSSGSTSNDGEADPNTTGTTDDRMVAMLADSGMESGAPGKLYHKYFEYKNIGTTLTYFPVGIGWGMNATFNDYLETLAGSYPTKGVGSTSTWVETDRIFTVGNGSEEGSESDALTIYKSGLAVHEGAVKIGDYSHGGATPENGTFRFANSIPEVYIDGWQPLMTSLSVANQNTKAGSVTINTGSNFIAFGEAFAETVVAVTVIPLVRRISDNAVIDFVLSGANNTGFTVEVWDDGVQVSYIATPTGSNTVTSDITTAIESYIHAGTSELSAGWNWITIVEMASVAYNIHCQCYDSSGDEVGYKIEWSTIEVTRFRIWVNEACTARWTIIKHTI
jgi:hypothetical protein